MGAGANATERKTNMKFEQSLLAAQLLLVNAAVFAQGLKFYSDGKTNGLWHRSRFQVNSKITRSPRPQS